MTHRVTPVDLSSLIAKVTELSPPVQLDYIIIVYVSNGNLTNTIFYFEGWQNRKLPYNQPMNIPIRDYWQLLATYLRPQRGRVLWLSLLVIAGIILQLANPQFVRYFLDQVENGGSLNQLLGAGAIFTGVALVRQVILLVAAYVGENVAWTATNELRADLALHCLRLDMGFHKTHKPGELMERVDGDVNQLAQFFSTLVIQFASNTLLALGILIIFWTMSWKIGAGITLVAIIVIVTLRWFNQRIVPRWARSREASASLFGYLEEWLSGMEDIRTSGAEPFVMNKLHLLSRERLNAQMYAERLHALQLFLPTGSFTFAYIVAHIFGATLFRDNILSIGTLYLIFYYIDVIRDPMWKILRQVEELQKATASIQRISELFAEQPTIHSGSGVEFSTGALAVQFSGVSFAYADDPENFILEDVSFSLAAGKTLGVLGRTGSGKSTLTKLLFRFYDPTHGTIMLDQHDIRLATTVQLRGQIGMVTQDVELFHASVRDNLTLFDDTVDDVQILDVLAQLGLTDWLAKMPALLDSKIEGSGGLSAGEGQLLAFARVFLADPGLVILDEASSRLDPATETQIELAINKLLTKRTAIIVAHRLATIQRADDILILQQGKVLEYGNRMASVADPYSHFSKILQTGVTGKETINVS
jgi:ATP-binding cassette subfamily B protein